MILKTAKSMALTALLISTSGCQLLIDNRSRESGAVVVVPSAEWDAMRQASLAAREEAANDDPDEMPAAPKSAKITPTPGSETITFTNYTGANLGGCATIGIIELQHRGDIDDAITLLKNEAFRLNGNLLLPIKLHSKQIDDYTMVLIEARILACPLKLARGN